MNWRPLWMIWFSQESDDPNDSDDSAKRVKQHERTEWLVGMGAKGLCCRNMQKSMQLLILFKYFN